MIFFLKGVHQCFNLMCMCSICTIAPNNILTQISIKREPLINGFLFFSPKGTC